MTDENRRAFEQWKFNRVTMNMGLNNIKNFENSIDVESHPLNRIPIDRFYNNMQLNKNSPLTNIKSRAGDINSTLSSINDLNDDINQMESLNAKINEELSIKERFTYSVLLKLCIIAIFVIIALATILINNQTMYAITSIIFLLAFVANFTIIK